MELNSRNPTGRSLSVDLRIEERVRSDEGGGVQSNFFKYLYSCSGEEASWPGVVATGARLLGFATPIDH